MSDMNWNLVKNDDDCTVSLFTFSTEFEMIGEEEHEIVAKHEKGCVEKIEAVGSDNIRFTLKNKEELCLRLKQFSLDSIFSALIGQHTSTEQFIKDYHKHAPNPLLTVYSFKDDEDEIRSFPDDISEPKAVEASRRYSEQYTVNIENLIEPDDKYSRYRVRNISESRVSSLAKDMMQTAEMPWTGPPLSVLAVDVNSYGELQAQGIQNTKYIILDGNHRYRAMVLARKLSKSPIYSSVPCVIYINMSVEEGLKIGCEGNKMAENVMKMTDFDRVKLFRSQFPASDDIIRQRLVLDKDLAKMYNIFGITTRKEKLAFQPITALTKLSVRCWNIVEGKFEANINMKASSFNCLGKLSEEEIFTYLNEAKESKDFLLHLRSACKEKKSAKKSLPLELEFLEDMIKVTSGKKIIYGNYIKVIIDGESNIIEPEVLKALLKKNESPESAVHQVTESSSKESPESPVHQVTGSSSKDSSENIHKTKKRPLSVSLIETPESPVHQVTGSSSKDSSENIHKAKKRPLTVSLIESPESPVHQVTGSSSKESPESPVHQVTGSSSKDSSENIHKAKKRPLTVSLIETPESPVHQVTGSSSKESPESPVHQVTGSSSKDSSENIHKAKKRPLTVSLIDSSDDMVKPKKTSPVISLDGISKSQNRSSPVSVTDKQDALMGRKKRKIIKKIIFDPDATSSPKKNIEAAEEETTTDEITLDNITDIDEDICFERYPSDIKVGDWILIKSPKEHAVDDELAPWIGVTTKCSTRMIYFDWCDGDFTPTSIWQTGTYIPKSDKTRMENIIAKFRWNFKTDPMPSTLQSAIQKLWNS